MILCSSFFYQPDSRDFIHNQSMPLFLLTAFSKSEQGNLTKSQRNELAGLTKFLVQNYMGNNG